MIANCKYQEDDKNIFDYNLTDVKISNVCGFRNFDGKQKDIVCIGSAQTMGRFVHHDYPSLIEHNSNYSVANLGWGGAGVHKYDTQEFIEYINRAKLLIYQIMSGRSTRNFNKNFNFGDIKTAQRACELIKLYENDFEIFIKYFTKNNEDYLCEFHSFRNKIKVPVVYIYVSPDKMSERKTPSKDKSTYPLIYCFPHLVTYATVKQMMENDKLGCFVQAKFNRLPKKIKGMMAPQIYSDVFATNQYYPDQETHYDIAEFCIKNISDLI